MTSGCNATLTIYCEPELRVAHDLFLFPPPLSLSQNVAVGPSLGLVKSSSLESLHNVMHHHIIRDVVDDGPGGSGRRPGRRNSFKRNTVSHSYVPPLAEGGVAEDEEDQHEVDGKVGIGLARLLHLLN